MYIYINTDALYCIQVQLLSIYIYVHNVSNVVAVKLYWTACKNVGQNWQLQCQKHDPQSGLNPQKLKGIYDEYMGFFPPNHPLKHRVFHYFHHPFWGISDFWKHPYK